MKFFGGIIVTALFMVLFLFLSISSFADSLVSIKEIRYSSVSEKVAFKQFFISSKTEYAEIELLLAMNPEYDLVNFQVTRDDIQRLTNRYKTSNDKTLRKVRKIRKELNKIFSGNDHTEKNSRVQGSSDYYKISQSIPLLSGLLIFEELEIPYKILRKDTQISLLALPNQSEIVIGHTPSCDINRCDNNFKEAYLNYLADCHLIDQDTPDQVAVNKFFRDNFLYGENINKHEFVSEHYISLAIDQFFKQEYFDAMHWAEKAYLLHPHKESAFLILYSLAHIMDGTDTSDPIYSKYVARLIRFENRGVTREQLIGIFLNLTNRQLLFEANTELYDESFNRIISEIDDSLLFNEISFIYNFERGRALFLNAEYIEAEPFIATAFSINPEDSNVRSMFYSILLARLEQLKTGDDAYTFTKFEDYFKKISKYKAEFPVLNDMLGFRQAWLYFCLGLMDQSYKFNDSFSGERYRLLFENDYPEPIEYFEALDKGIANAYASAADYYRKENDMDKSHELANRGLDYIPGNPRLISFRSKR